MEKNDIIAIIKNQVSTDVNITDESDLIDDLCFSSLDMFLLICDIEAKLKIQVNIKDFVGVKTVGQLIKVINRYKENE